MKIRFKNIGRGKASWVAECKDGDEIYKELRKHLLSVDLDWSLSSTNKTYIVWAGGVRVVGSFEILDKFSLTEEMVVYFDCKVIEPKEGVFRIAEYVSFDKETKAWQYIEWPELFTSDTTAELHLAKLNYRHVKQGIWRKK